MTRTRVGRPLERLEDPRLGVTHLDLPLTPARTWAARAGR